MMLISVFSYNHSQLLAHLHSLTIIISIQNMSYHKTPDFLTLCSHLQTEWFLLPSQIEQQTSFTYQHIYSADQSEARYLESVTMKDLDIYSSRESYSFPFCPKIYKCIIEKNRQQSSQLIFDIAVLMEKVPHRLKSDARLNCLKTVKMLLGKTTDIVSGFSYLYRRFGLFKIKEEMIGWTNLGIIKVWLNQDFGVNKKFETVENQQTMVLDLVKILSENGLLRCSIKKSTTFEALLKNMSLSQMRTQSELQKKQVSFVSRNLSDYRQSTQIPSNRFVKSPDSRKNITFSYSNKDLSFKNPINPNMSYKTPKNYTKTQDNKRVSIQLDPNQLNTLVRQFNQSNECSGMTIQVKSPTANSAKGSKSGARTDKKKFTYFKSDYGMRKDQNENDNSKLKILKQHFSKTTQSSVYRKEVPTIDQLSKQLKQNRGIPEFLHYSTSSNPISKLFKAKRADSKTFSTNGSSKTQYCEQDVENLEKSKIDSNQSQYSQRTFDRISREEAVKGMKTFQIKEQQVNLRQSQEVQKDLDALFDSNHQFDYNALENELDCIL